MPRDAVSRTANVERTGRHKWVKGHELLHWIYAQRKSLKIPFKLRKEYDRRDSFILDYEPNGIPLGS